MIENNLEKLIQDSFINYFSNQELSELTAKFTELHKQGYQFGFIDSISGNILQWDIKKVFLPIKWFTKMDFNIGTIIDNEKQAAIYLQHFEYAAKIRDFEIFLQDEKLILNNPDFLMKIINPKLDYCVIIREKTIYMYLNSQPRQFLIKIKDLVNLINTNTTLPNYSEFIKEMIFKVEENEPLPEFLRNVYDGYWRFVHENHYVYLVYVDDIKPIVLHINTNGSEDSLWKPHISFIEHLININISDFKQLTLLVTFFRYLKTPLKSYNGQKIPAIESLLVDSGGWIVYQHHLENLFCMSTGCNKEEAIALSEKFNNRPIRKSDSFYDTPLCGTTVGQIMQERMLADVVLYPDYHTANLLFDYLNKKKQNGRD